jgi:beta-phosphoglucomutase-like phosphatase (HAD superfamily)
MTIKAAIFDWDGTLADSHEAHFLANRDTLRDLGLVLERSWYDAHTGTSTDEVIAILSAAQGKSVSTPLHEVSSRCTAAYLGHLDKVEPIAWVVAVAESLSGRLAIAVASGASRTTVQPTMKAIGLGDLFPVVITREDVSRGKPSPEIFLLAAHRLGVAPAQCLVFEDSDEGIEAARLAQMPAIDVRVSPSIGKR